MMTSSLVTFIFIGTIILIIYWLGYNRTNNTLEGFVNVQRPIPNAQSGRLSNLNLKRHNQISSTHHPINTHGSYSTSSCTDCWTGFHRRRAPYYPYYYPWYHPYSWLGWIKYNDYYDNCHNYAISQCYDSIFPERCYANYYDRCRYGL